MGILLFLIFVSSIISLYFKVKNKKPVGIILSIIGILGSIGLDLVKSYLYDYIKINISPNRDSISISETVNSDFFDETEDTLFTENISTEESKETLFTENTNVSDTEEVNGILNNIEDITAETSISGKITYEGQEDKYLYTASVSGTYLFSTDLSSGGSVKVAIDGENGKNIKYNYDELVIDLEAGKTYILCIGYANGPCDYTVDIGVPNEIKDITGKTSVSGSITYKEQGDKYRYTVEVSGTYHFSTDLSAGGSVKVSIDGENGKNIKYNYNKLTIDLEAGKTYILCIEYANGPCDYTVDIGVPNEIKEITGKTSVSGSITYEEQKDKYIYIPDVSGEYNFSTNLSPGGGVRIRISGENGNSVKYDFNKLTIDLEAGKTYILSVEYNYKICTYEVFIEH
mgnify:CR=1 FL=1